MHNSFFVDFRGNNMIYSDVVVWTNLCIHYLKKAKLEIDKGYSMVVIIAVAKIKILCEKMISQEMQLATMNILTQPHLGDLRDTFSTWTGGGGGGGGIHPL